MKFTPYKTILAMGKEAKDKALAPIRAATAKQKAKLEMAKLDEKIATAETGIIEASSEKDVDFYRIIEKLDDIALAERRKKQFIEIVNGMFPENEE